MWWTFLMRRKNPRGGSLWGFLVLMKTMIDIKKKLYGIPYSFMTCPGIEPGFTPWEGVVLTAWPTGQNRGDKIRTCDLCVPNAALYQTEPRLDVFKAFCFVLFTSDSYIIAWPWKKCKRFFEKISICYWRKKRRSVKYIFAPLVRLCLDAAGTVSKRARLGTLKIGYCLDEKWYKPTSSLNDHMKEPASVRYRGNP